MASAAITSRAWHRLPPGAGNAGITPGSDFQKSPILSVGDMMRGRQGVNIGFHPGVWDTRERLVTPYPPAETYRL